MIVGATLVSHSGGGVVFLYHSFFIFERGWLERNLRNCVEVNGGWLTRANTVLCMCI